MLPVIAAAERHSSRIAVGDARGEHTYARLLQDARQVAGFLLRQAGAADLRETRVAFLTSPDSRYVATLWGVWLAGGITVPLCPAHPPAELRYFVENSEADLLIADRAHIEKLAETGGNVLCLEEVLEEPLSPPAMPNVDPDRRANILYTSGTTNRPKGVVTTHRQIAGQIGTLIEAWRWREDDRALNVLPLHHTHGLINVVSCALFAGARLEMQNGFAAAAVWNAICEGRLTVFMAVPTIYSKLIQFFHERDEAARRTFSAACRRLRLMVSGSAALPEPVFRAWEEISGHRLLERYGMTEIGMALSNPYEGPRLPGTVGRPLPHVEVRLDEAGQILVRGPYIFKEYWKHPEATRKAFHEGWFCTGDIAREEDGYVRILGRDNIDIIKSGGYKISALEIESVLKSHPRIADAAVVGLPDPEWGERTAACLVMKDGASISLDELRTWAQGHLAKYKLPTRILCVGELPKNAMGKVTKKEIQRMMKERE